MRNKLAGHDDARQLTCENARCETSNLVKLPVQCFQPGQITGIVLPTWSNYRYHHLQSYDHSEQLSSLFSGFRGGVPVLVSNRGEVTPSATRMMDIRNSMESKARQSLAPQAQAPYSNTVRARLGIGINRWVLETAD